MRFESVWNLRFFLGRFATAIIIMMLSITTREDYPYANISVQSLETLIIRSMKLLRRNFPLLHITDETDNTFVLQPKENYF